MEESLVQMQTRLRLNTVLLIKVLFYKKNNQWPLSMNEG